MRGQKLPFVLDEAGASSSRGAGISQHFAREGTTFRELARETNAVLDGLHRLEPVGPGQGAGKLIAQQIADGNLDGLFTLLSQSQLSHLAHSSHPPLYALTRLRHAVETALAASTSADDTGETKGALYPYPHMLSQQFFLVTEGF